MHHLVNSHKGRLKEPRKMALQQLVKSLTVSLLALATIAVVFAILGA